MTALKHWLAFLLILVSGSFPAEAQDAKPLRGVALIIGQANYAHVAPLPNAGADARAIGKLMTDLGFETRLAPDRDAKALKREIDRFIEDAEGTDVAFVYYAGHGIEAAGENWLVPVDADLSSLADARQRLVASSQLVERLKQAAPVVIFLLDACRNSPFPAEALLKPDAQSAAASIVGTGLAPTRGATVVADQASGVENVGVVMGFAAEPGHAALDGPQGGNSPYAQALLRHLAAIGGAELGDVMTMVTEEVYLATETRQRPWVNASMRRLLYFGVAAQEGDKDEALITGERRKLLLTIAALPVSGRRQVETIAKADGVPLDSLYGMLRSLGAETPKDPAELDGVLRAQAQRLKSILAETAALRGADPEIVRLSGLADRALAQGALQTAISFREQAKGRAATVSDALADTEAALRQRRLEIAEVFAKSAGTYTLAFNFRAAAEDFAKAFDEAERWDSDRAWTYKIRAADALSNQGLYKGDASALEEAVAVYEEAGRAVSEEANPEAGTRAKLGLAMAMKTLGEREAGTSMLRKSIA
ncbi:MAG: caspase domain-containing protein, partial [Parvibaculaceae bacterium]